LSRSKITLTQQVLVKPGKKKKVQAHFFFNPEQLRSRAQRYQVTAEKVPCWVDWDMGTADLARQVLDSAGDPQEQAVHLQRFVDSLALQGVRLDKLEKSLEDEGTIYDLVETGLSLRNAF